jgi:hypothetical protein
MGCYTTMKAFVTKDFANLRKFWRPVFKGGWVCCAHQWHQSAKKGSWPSVFSVFDCRQRGKWGEMVYDILEYSKNDINGVITGEKKYRQEDTKRSFRNYFFPNENLPKDELTVVQANGLKAFGGKTKMTNWRPKGTWASAGLISAYLRTRDQSRGMVSGNVIDNLVPIFINERNYKRVLGGLGLYWSVTHTWVNHEDCFLAPLRDLTPQETADAILYALMCTRNRTTTARLDYAPQGIKVGNKNNVANGGIVENKLNPFDTQMFDWSECSDVGKNVLQLYRHYLDNIVKWKEQDTVLGKGEWLGIYQYHRIVPIPKELVDAIEKLREAVENTAQELCF